MEKKERNFLCVLTVHTRLSPVLLVELWLRERAGKKFQLFLSFAPPSLSNLCDFTLIFPAANTLGKKVCLPVLYFVCGNASKEKYFSQ